MFTRFYDGSKGRARIAQFMSGSGTNVERVLEQEGRMGDDCPYKTVVLVTDDDRSNARLLGARFSIPVLTFDIRAFQESRGLGRKLSLRTEGHRIAREAYSSQLLDALPEIDFGVFGGFESLVNFVKNVPCLNVHPGDTTYLVDCRPYLVGLHTVPIQRALDVGLSYVRSSVIQSMPYTGAGGDMDNGPTLGLGPRLLIEGERDAARIQKALKVVSDWKILPRVVLAVARGELEVDYESNEIKGRVVMDEEIRISDVCL